jgi:hypothetical protein
LLPADGNRGAARPFPPPIPPLLLPEVTFMKRFLLLRGSRSWLPVGVAVLVVVLAVAAAWRRSSADAMRTSAVALIELMQGEKIEQLVKPFDVPSRVGWHFIPKKERKGVALREMDEAQRAASLRLLRAGLSQAGYDKASQIMLMEQVLRILEGEDRTWERDYQKYYVTIFGNPQQDDSRWGFSFEGHHLSLNFVCRGGRVLDSTPQFFAANPATLKSDVPGAPLRKGTRILADEEQLAFELVNTLSAAQREQAIIAAEAPAEIRAAGEPQPPNTPPEGIAYRELNSDQLQLLERLVEVYAEAMPAEVAAERLRAIREQTWGNVHFAWAGATEPGIGHYYRIQGPTFLIEFVNTQPDAEGNPANHIHCVWRDMDGDFDLPIDG